MKKITKKIEHDKFQFVRNDTKVALFCPLHSQTRCGSWCAWLDVQLVHGAVGFPDRTVATCKGEPIGEVVEETP